MMGTFPRQSSKNVPAFLDDLHRSLHSAYHTVRNHIQSAHQHNKQRYDKERPYTPFMVGDQVWLHVPVYSQTRENEEIHIAMERAIHSDGQNQYI